MKQYIIFSLLAVLIACSKKEADLSPDTNSDKSDIVLAGKSSASFYFGNPDIVVKGISKDTNNSICNLGGYSYLDSVQIDLDADQQMDLQFKFKKLFIAGCACGPSCDIFPLADRRFEVKGLGDVYFACKPFTASPIMTPGNFPDTLNLNYPITKNLVWEKGKKILRADNFYSGTGHWGWEGHDVVVNKYLGIMKIKPSQDTVYGWVKLEIADQIKIEEFALEK